MASARSAASAETVNMTQSSGLRPSPAAEPLLLTAADPAVLPDLEQGLTPTPAPGEGEAASTTSAKSSRTCRAADGFVHQHQWTSNCSYKTNFAPSAFPASSGGVAAPAPAGNGNGNGNAHICVHLERQGDHHRAALSLLYSEDEEEEEEYQSEDDQQPRSVLNRRNFGKNKKYFFSCGSVLRLTTFCLYHWVDYWSNLLLTSLCFFWHYKTGEVMWAFSGICGIVCIVAAGSFSCYLALGDKYWMRFGPYTRLLLCVFPLGLGQGMIYKLAYHRYIRRKHVTGDVAASSEGSPYEVQNSSAPGWRFHTKSFVGLYESTFFAGLAAYMITHDLEGVSLLAAASETDPAAAFPGSSLRVWFEGLVMYVAFLTSCWTLAHVAVEIDYRVSAYIKEKTDHSRWFSTCCIAGRVVEVVATVMTLGFVVRIISILSGRAAMVSSFFFVSSYYFFDVAQLWAVSPHEKSVIVHFLVGFMYMSSDLGRFVDHPGFARSARTLKWRVQGQRVFVFGLLLLAGIIPVVPFLESTTSLTLAANSSGAGESAAVPPAEGVVGGGSAAGGGVSASAPAGWTPAQLPGHEISAAAATGGLVDGVTPAAPPIGPPQQVVAPPVGQQQRQQPLVGNRNSQLSAAQPFLGSAQQGGVARMQELPPDSVPQTFASPTAQTAEAVTLASSWNLNFFQLMAAHHLWLFLFYLIMVATHLLIRVVQEYYVSPDRDDIFLLTAAGDVTRLKLVLTELSKLTVDVNHRRENGHAPLHVASKYNTVECLEVLLLYGKANINLPTSRGKTALHIAAEEAHLQSVRQLVASGATVNPQDSEGNTPLHLAAAKHHHEVVKYLIRTAGARTDIVNYQGDLWYDAEEVGGGKGSSGRRNRKHHMRERAHGTMRPSPCHMSTGSTSSRWTPHSGYNGRSKAWSRDTELAELRSSVACGEHRDMVDWRASSSSTATSAGGNGNALSQSSQTRRFSKTSLGSVPEEREVARKPSRATMPRIRSQETELHALDGGGSGAGTPNRSGDEMMRSTSGHDPSSTTTLILGEYADTELASCPRDPRSRDTTQSIAALPPMEGDSGGRSSEEVPPLPSSSSSSIIGSYLPALFRSASSEDHRESSGSNSKPGGGTTSSSGGTGSEGTAVSDRLPGEADCCGGPAAAGVAHEAAILNPDEENNYSPGGAATVDAVDTSGRAPVRVTMVTPGTAGRSDGATGGGGLASGSGSSCKSPAAAEVANKGTGPGASSSRAGRYTAWLNHLSFARLGGLPHRTSSGESPPPPSAAPGGEGGRQLLQGAHHSSSHLPGGASKGGTSGAGAVEWEMTDEPGRTIDERLVRVEPATQDPFPATAHQASEQRYFFYPYYSCDPERDNIAGHILRPCGLSSLIFSTATPYVFGRFFLRTVDEERRVLDPEYYKRKEAGKQAIRAYRRESFSELGGKGMHHPDHVSRCHSDPFLNDCKLQGIASSGALGASATTANGLFNGTDKRVSGPRTRMGAEGTAGSTALSNASGGADVGSLPGGERDPAPPLRTKKPPRRRDPLQLLDWNKLGPSDFTVVQQLGRGTFGTVMKVQLKDDPEIVLALKLLSKKQYKVQNIVCRYYAEEHVLRTVKHPFIVLLYATFSTPLHWMLLMEYCPGGDLHDLLVKEGRPGLPQLAVMKAATEILLALEFLHGRGIVFRDLKCENVILSASRTCRLTDFGLAKEDLDAGRLDGVYSFCGSYGYCAPEVLVLKQSKVSARRGGAGGHNAPGEATGGAGAGGRDGGGAAGARSSSREKGPKGYGHAVDIYSFGVVLFMLVTGGQKMVKKTAGGPQQPAVAGKNAIAGGGHHGAKNTGNVQAAGNGGKRYLQAAAHHQKIQNAEYSTAGAAAKFAAGQQARRGAQQHGGDVDENARANAVSKSNHPAAARRGAANDDCSTAASRAPAREEHSKALPASKGANVHGANNKGGRGNNTPSSDKQQVVEENRYPPTNHEELRGELEAVMLWRNRGPSFRLPTNRQQYVSMRERFARWQQHPYLLDLVGVMVNESGEKRGTCETMRGHQYFLHVDFSAALNNSGRHFREVALKLEQQAELPQAPQAAGSSSSTSSGATSTEAPAQAGRGGARQGRLPCADSDARTEDVREETTSAAASRQNPPQQAAQQENKSGTPTPSANMHLQLAFGSGAPPAVDPASSGAEQPGSLSLAANGTDTKNAEGLAGRADTTSSTSAASTGMLAAPTAQKKISARLTTSTRATLCSPPTPDGDSPIDEDPAEKGGAADQKDSEVRAAGAK